MRQEIPGGYQLDGKRQVGFQVAAYDITKPLILKPALEYFTYLGGSGIAVDSSANTYVTGTSESTNYPMGNPLQPPNLGGQSDILIAKIVDMPAAGLTLPPNSVVNGASFRPATDPNGAIAPGTIVAIFGTDLASSTQLAPAVPLPTLLLETSVTFNSIPAPLYFVSPTQINAQVPFDVPTGTVSVEVNNGAATATQSITVAAVSPGIFTLNTQGTGFGAILHADTFELITNGNPTQSGEFLSIFCTGLGLLNSPVTSGDIPSVPPPETLNQPQVEIAGIPAQVSYSGLAPGFVGLYQVNVEVPAGVPPGIQSLQIIIDGVPSNTVNIAIRDILDTIPPVAVTNLIASNPSSATIDLTWTSPGDDGSMGTAAFYDIRYSTSPITDSIWSTATPVSGEPAPQVAGTSQSMTISGLLSSTIYYFAIKTADEVSNISGLSNVASSTTLFGATGWTQVFPPSGPTHTGESILVFDQNISKTLYYSSDNLFTQYGNSLWAYDSTTKTWEMKTHSGSGEEAICTNSATHPADRHPYHMTYDTTRGRTYTYGSHCSNSSIVTGFTDTWYYDSAANSWIEVFPTTNPGIRNESSIAYDSTNDLIVLYGGLDECCPNNETWHYIPSTNTWQQITTTGNPGLRGGHSMVYDSVNQHVVMFGGYRTYIVAIDELWLYNPATKTWINPNPSVGPPPTVWPPLAFDPTRGLVVLYAGLNNVWTYDVAAALVNPTTAWQNLNITGGPDPNNEGFQSISMTYDSSTDTFIAINTDGFGVTEMWELKLP
ncbi:MAG: hypothetical protein O7A06_15105 [Acidobacteria bacterium]|nr:hypothetical protein [Acidobacteriota bacterium]